MQDDPLMSLPAWLSALLDRQVFPITSEDGGSSFPVRAVKTVRELLLQEEGHFANAPTESVSLPLNSELHLEVRLGENQYLQVLPWCSQLMVKPSFEGRVRLIQYLLPCTVPQTMQDPSLSSAVGTGSLCLGEKAYLGFPEGTYSSTLFSCNVSDDQSVQVGPPLLTVFVIPSRDGDHKAYMKTLIRRFNAWSACFEQESQVEGSSLFPSKSREVFDGFFKAQRFTSIGNLTDPLQLATQQVTEIQQVLRGDQSLFPLHKLGLWAFCKLFLLVRRFLLTQQFADINCEEMMVYSFLVAGFMKACFPAEAHLYRDLLEGEGLLPEEVQKLLEIQGYFHLFEEFPEAPLDGEVLRAVSWSSPDFQRGVANEGGENADVLLYVADTVKDAQGKILAFVALDLLWTTLDIFSKVDEDRSRNRGALLAYLVNPQYSLAMAGFEEGAELYQEVSEFLVGLKEFFVNLQLILQGQGSVEDLIMIVRATLSTTHTVFEHVDASVLVRLQTLLLGMGDLLTVFYHLSLEDFFIATQDLYRRFPVQALLEEGILASVDRALGGLDRYGNIYQDQISSLVSSYFAGEDGEVAEETLAINPSLLLGLTASSWGRPRTLLVQQLIRQLMGSDGFYAALAEVEKCRAAWREASKFNECLYALRRQKIEKLQQMASLPYLVHLIPGEDYGVPPYFSLLIGGEQTEADRSKILKLLWTQGLPFIAGAAFWDHLQKYLQDYSPHHQLGLMMNALHFWLKQGGELELSLFTSLFQNYPEHQEEIFQLFSFQYERGLQVEILSYDLSKVGEYCRHYFEVIDVSLVQGGTWEQPGRLLLDLLKEVSAHKKAVNHAHYTLENSQDEAAKTEARKVIEVEKEHLERFSNEYKKIIQQFENQVRVEELEKLSENGEGSSASSPQTVLQWWVEIALILPSLQNSARLKLMGPLFAELYRISVQQSWNLENHGQLVEYQKAWQTLQARQGVLADLVRIPHAIMKNECELYEDNVRLLAKTGFKLDFQSFYEMIAHTQACLAMLVPTAPSEILNSLARMGGGLDGFKRALIQANEEVHEKSNCSELQYLLSSGHAGTASSGLAVFLTSLLSPYGATQKNSRSRFERCKYFLEHFVNAALLRQVANGSPLRYLWHVLAPFQESLFPNKPDQAHELYALLLRVVVRTEENGHHQISDLLTTRDVSGGSLLFYVLSTCPQEKIPHIIKEIDGYQRWLEGSWVLINFFKSSPLKSEVLDTCIQVLKMEYAYLDAQFSEELLNHWVSYAEQWISVDKDKYVEVLALVVDQLARHNLTWRLPCLSPAKQLALDDQVPGEEAETSQALVASSVPLPVLLVTPSAENQVSNVQVGEVETSRTLATLSADPSGSRSPSRPVLLLSTTLSHEIQSSVLHLLMYHQVSPEQVGRILRKGRLPSPEQEVCLLGIDGQGKTPLDYWQQGSPLWRENVRPFLYPYVAPEMLGLFNSAVEGILRGCQKIASETKAENLRVLKQWQAKSSIKCLSSCSPCLREAILSVLAAYLDAQQFRQFLESSELPGSFQDLIGPLRESMKVTEEAILEFIEQEIAQKLQRRWEQWTCDFPGDLFSIIKFGSNILEILEDVEAKAASCFLEGSVLYKYLKDLKEACETPVLKSIQQLSASVYPRIVRQSSEGPKPSPLVLQGSKPMTSQEYIGRYIPVIMRTVGYFFCGLYAQVKQFSISSRFSGDVAAFFEMQSGIFYWIFDTFQAGLRLSPVQIQRLTDWINQRPEFSKEQKSKWQAKGERFKQENCDKEPLFSDDEFQAAILNVLDELLSMAYFGMLLSCVNGQGKMMGEFCGDLDDFSKNFSQTLDKLCSWIMSLPPIFSGPPPGLDLPPLFNCQEFVQVLRETLRGLPEFLLAHRQTIEVFQAQRAELSSALGAPSASGVFAASGPESVDPGGIEQRYRALLETPLSALSQVAPSPSA